MLAANLDKLHLKLVGKVFGSFHHILLLCLTTKGGEQRREGVVCTAS